MDCFINYIGLSLCAGAYDAPASGIYINSLPGLNIESIDKIADQEQVNYVGVWADVQNNALTQLRLDIMTEIQKCYQVNNDCDYDAMICDNIEVFTQSWKYLLGVWILLYRINSNRLNRFTTVTIDQAKELKDHYQVEYEKFLSQAVKVMDISSCELCCGGNPQIVTWLP
jgi:hypothetical protein